MSILKPVTVALILVAAFFAGVIFSRIALSKETPKFTQECLQAAALSMSEDQAIPQRERDIASLKSTLCTMQENLHSVTQLLEETSQNLEKAQLYFDKRLQALETEAAAERSLREAEAKRLEQELQEAIRREDLRMKAPKIPPLPEKTAVSSKKKKKKKTGS